MPDEKGAKKAAGPGQQIPPQTPPTAQSGAVPPNPPINKPPDTNVGGNGENAEPHKQPEVDKIDDRTARATEGLARWTKWLALATIIVAVVGIIQAGYTRSALLESKTQFSRTERPFILYADGSNHFTTIGHGASLRVSFSFQSKWINYGRSPATHVGFARKVVPFFDESMPGLAREGYVINQITSVEPSIQSFERNDSGDLPPNNQVWLTDTASTDFLTPAEAMYIQRHDWGWVVVDRATYSDIDGNTYDTQICYYNRVAGGAGSCEYGNYVH